MFSSCFPTHVLPCSRVKKEKQEGDTNRVDRGVQALLGHGFFGPYVNEIIPPNN